MSTYTIRHTHGITEHHDSWDSAWAALVAAYGAEIIAVDRAGWGVDADSEPDPRSGRILVWEDEASSEDDDGARTVASVEG